jgi:hypothetical protein
VIGLDGIFGYPTPWGFLVSADAKEFREKGRARKKDLGRRTARTTARKKSGAEAPHPQRLGKGRRARRPSLQVRGEGVQRGEKSRKGDGDWLDCEESMETVSIALATR